VIGVDSGLRTISAGLYSCATVVLRIKPIDDPGDGMKPSTFPPLFKSLSAALAWSAGRVSIGMGGTLPA
jgi:hypothetical protein